MDICPNCCEELVEKKYNHTKRLKCTECGYETSKREITEEIHTYYEVKAQRKKELYKQNDNLL